jgi:CheY-like chemotaxis protein
LKLIKENPRTAHIPVVIHTSKTLDQNDYALLHEAAAILTKSSKAEEVSIAHFAEAFRQAGCPIPLSEGEVHHA